MTALRLGSLFDGIGVFPLAAVRCGIEPIWASEIEKAPISITKRHFPDMVHLGDVTKLDGRDLPPVHTINYNGQAVAVEVTLEVYEFLDRADHKTENLFHEQRRHWDGREFDEYIITTEGVGVYGETPEEYLCRMETLHELMAVLDTCTEVQRRRFLLYALDGLSLAEIGVLCGCSKVAVYQSVEAVRKKFINFFENRLNE